MLRCEMPYYASTRGRDQRGTNMHASFPFLPGGRPTDAAVSSHRYVHARARCAEDASSDEARTQAPSIAPFELQCNPMCCITSDVMAKVPRHSRTESSGGTQVMPCRPVSRGACSLRRRQSRTLQHAGSDDNAVACRWHLRTQRGGSSSVKTREPRVPHGAWCAVACRKPKVLLPFRRQSFCICHSQTITSKYKAYYFKPRSTSHNRNEP